jgi:hypothetical protein
MGIVVTIGTFGDAARVNIVYTLRGLWGVVLAWLLAKRFGIPEASHGGRIMLWRLSGAALLVSAVAIAIMFG